MLGSGLFILFLRVHEGKEAEKERERERDGERQIDRECTSQHLRRAETWRK